MGPGRSAWEGAGDTLRQSVGGANLMSNGIGHQPTRERTQRGVPRGALSPTQTCPTQRVRTRKSRSPGTSTE
eukprot:12121947-Alexandrium_andersonii.AAC.1